MHKGRVKKDEQRGRKRLEIREEINFYYKVPIELLGVLDFSYLCDKIPDRNLLRDEGFLLSHSGEGMAEFTLPIRRQSWTWS